MDKIKKQSLLVIGIALIAVGLIALREYVKPFSVWHFGQNKEDFLEVNPNASTTPENSTSTPESTGKLSYQDALKKYKNRIQFSQCHGTPGYTSVKRNIPVMLDNRDNKAHTFRVAGQSYFVGRYDYSLAYISKEGTYNLTCDGGGAAAVNVEK